MQVKRIAIIAILLLCFVAAAQATDYNLVTETGTSFVRTDADGGFSVFGPLGVIVVEPADTAIASWDVTTFFGGHYLVHWPDDGSIDTMQPDQNGGFEVLSKQLVLHVEPDDNGTYTIVTEDGDLMGWMEPLMTSSVTTTRSDVERQVSERYIYINGGVK